MGKQKNVNRNVGGKLIIIAQISSCQLCWGDLVVLIVVTPLSKKPIIGSKYLEFCIEKKSYMHLWAALHKASFITIVQNCLEFSVVDSFGLFALNSKRYCTIIIQDD